MGADITQYLDIIEERCTGCRICELTCSVEHFGVYNPKKSRIKVKRDPLPGKYSIYVCNSCDKYSCKDACPKDAINLIDVGHGNKKAFILKDKCTNCGLCAKACPYNAVIRAPSRIFLICDTCDGAFRCSEECPVEAILIKEIAQGDIKS